MNKNFLVHFVSLGCAKNLVDSEIVLGGIAKRYKMTASPHAADVIIVNTCGFIESAKKETLQVIFDLLPFKKRSFEKSTFGNCKAFILMGCLVQRYARELSENIEEIDYFFGVNDFPKIVDLLLSKNFFNILEDKNGKQEEKQKKDRLKVKHESQSGIEEKRVFSASSPLFLQRESDRRLQSTPSYLAWLKIAEGCNRRCHFCAIPQIRGRHRSRSIDAIIKEAKNLVRAGVKELNVISQDLSQYGSDSQEASREKKALLELFMRLEEIKGLKWIRAFYYYPDEIDKDFIHLMKHSKKICHYLDMPIQHFSSAVLKRMNRKISGEEILEKLLYLKEEIPDLYLRTSLLLGHPGEREKDFEYLLEKVKRVKFDYLGAFAYSREEGTASYHALDQVKKSVAKMRVREVYKVQKKIQKEKLKGLLGKTLEVLIEGPHEETPLLIKARHQGQAFQVDSSVILNDLNEKKAKIGDFFQAQITDLLDYDLVARLI